MSETQEPRTEIVVEHDTVLIIDNDTEMELSLQEAQYLLRQLQKAVMTAGYNVKAEPYRYNLRPVRVFVTSIQ